MYTGVIFWQLIKSWYHCSHLSLIPHLAPVPCLHSCCFTAATINLPLGSLLSLVVLASVSLKRGEEAAGGKTGGSGSSFILSLLVVQDLDKLAVIDSVGRVGRYELTCMNSHVWIHIYEFMSETETSFQCRKLKPVSVVVLTSESFWKPGRKSLSGRKSRYRYSGENCDIAIRKKIAIWKKIARDRTVSKIAHSQTIIFI